MFRYVIILAVIPGFLWAQGAAERAKRLQAVERFGYQLQRINIATIVDSPTDMVIVDPKGESRRLSKEEVATLKRKPSGSRIVMAYLSIGEAERFRDYWQEEWTKTPPPWLSSENPEGKGNYKVKYWDPGWQKLILGQATSPLDRILAEGYDGVYLDLTDAIQYWEGKGEKNARTRMVDWVKAIAEYSRKIQPKFLVVPQNGEALAREKGYLDLIDGLGREDLYFHKRDKRQQLTDIDTALADIKLFQNAGKPVFLIEYVLLVEHRNQVVNRARLAGFVPLIAPRKLESWSVTPIYTKP